MSDYDDAETADNERSGMMGRGGPKQAPQHRTLAPKWFYIAFLGILAVLVLIYAFGGGGDNTPTPLALPTVDTVDGGSTAVYAECQLEATTQSVPGGGLAGGTVYLTYSPETGTDVEIVGHGMSPGKHGVHIHELGDLSDTAAGTTTGAHFNPGQSVHGCGPGAAAERKVGDLGNLLVDGSGEGYYAEQGNPFIRLGGGSVSSVVGRALVVHALEDNCLAIEGPAGDTSAGARIGHCTVGLVGDSAARHSQRGSIRSGYERLLGTSLG